MTTGGGGRPGLLLLSFCPTSPCARLCGLLAVGELSLDGRVRAVRGALPIALRARAAGVGGLLLPAANACEAAVVAGVDVYAVATLREAVGVVRRASA